MRRAARETVFKLVFEYTFYNERNDETLDLMLMDSSLDEEDKVYVRSTYDGIISETETLEKTISDNLENYKLERIYRPDLVALMLAVYELKKGEVPPAVVINEAVELSKKYGTEKSGGFVNGVLSKVLKAVK